MLDDTPRYPDPIKAMPLRPMDRAAMCEGKIAFPTPQIAHKAARRRRGEGVVRDVYLCRSCGQFHVGSPAVQRPKPEPRKIRTSGRDAWGQE